MACKVSHRSEAAADAVAAARPANRRIVHCSRCGVLAITSRCVAHQCSEVKQSKVVFAHNAKLALVFTFYGRALVFCTGG